MIEFVNTFKRQTAGGEHVSVRKGLSEPSSTSCYNGCSGSTLVRTTEACEKLIEDFNATWKAVFVKVSGEVMSFSNFIKGYLICLAPQFLPLCDR